MSDEFDPLTLHLRGERACQTQMWTRSQLEIFWTQLFPNFPELTRSENVCEIGTYNSKCETVEQISKRGYGNNFVFCWKKLISFWKKEQQNIPTRKRDDLVMSVVNNRGVRVAKPSRYNIGWNTI